ncbi:MAG: hypothetical protein NTX34_07265, partial [Cytophagales bacterium]|nr:hypothetical protein [Cytophagales bacterium]
MNHKLFYNFKTTILSAILFYFTSCSQQNIYLLPVDDVEGNTIKNNVVAHRGAWKKNKFPENSIASLREA